MINKFKITRIVVALLFVSGIFLRLWNLDKAPISLFGDEIDVGLQANSILTTGNDYMGNTLPVIFRSFAEHRLPLQLYLATPFVKIFGLNEWGVRGASVMMGFLSILGMYFLVKELFGKRISVIAMLIMLFSPWHFVLSRQANDSGFLLPFLIFGTLLFVKGMKDYKYLLYSAAFWGLGFYSYATFSLFAPLFVLILIIIFYRQFIKIGFSKIAVAAFLGLLMISPYLIESFKGSTTKRVSDIRVISNEELEYKVIQGRRWSDDFWRKLYYNKFTVTGSELFKSYTNAFSVNFLFADGDSNPRHNVGGFGQLYAFEMITVLIGIYFAFKEIKRNRNKYYLIILFWLIIAPIPAILTQGGGVHAPRLILMLPPLVIFSALGINCLMRIKRPLFNKVVAIFLSIITFFNVGNFLYRYFVIWPNESWRFWHYGFGQTIKFVKSIDNDYQKIYFNNTYEPMLPRFLFYYNYDMAVFQKQFTGDVHIENLEENFDGFSLGDRYYFGDLKKPVERFAKPGNLVVASGEKDITNPFIFENPGLKLLEVVTSPYKDSIFYVFTGN